MKSFLYNQHKKDFFNSCITPNRNRRIKGSKLKVAGERTKVYTTDIVTNSPSEFAIVTPGLAAGNYTDVRCVFICI